MRIDADFITNLFAKKPLEQESREDILALIKARRSLLDYALNQLNELERLLLASPVVTSSDAQVSEVASVDAEVAEVAASIKFDATLRMCVNAAHKFFETHEFNEGLPNSQVLEEFSALSFEHCPQHLDFLRDDIFKVQAFIANNRNSREKRLKRIASLKSELDDIHAQDQPSAASIRQSPPPHKAKAQAQRIDEHVRQSQELIRQAQTLVTVEEHIAFAENNMAFFPEDSQWKEYLIALIAFVRDTKLHISKTFLHEVLKKAVSLAFSLPSLEYDELEDKILNAVNCLFDGVSSSSVLSVLRKQIINFSALDVDLPEPTAKSLMFLSNAKNGVEDRLRRFKRDASSGVFGLKVMLQYGKLVVELYARAKRDTKLCSTAVDSILARSIFALAQNVVIVLDDFPAARADALDEALTLYSKNTNWKDLPKLSATSGRKRQFCVVIV